VHVYLAGPLFTPYERRFVDELAGLLREDGFEVFVPHEQEYLVPAHDVGPGAVFETDGRGIDAADALVAILDGPVVDDGTACEIGLFTGLARTDPAKKGIVGLLTDSRSAPREGRPQEGRGLNLYVQGCVESIGCIVAAPADVLDVLRAWRQPATTGA
jgi:nucleoside 2-deoxyribosyltransferase